LASITVSRDAGYADAVRAYAVKIDGKEVGKLMPGDSATYRVTPGNHTLQASIDWCGSKPTPVSVPDGANAAFSLHSALRGPWLFLALWYVLFDRSGYLEIKRTA
jgi:hypothetical protein